MAQLNNVLSGIHLRGWTDRELVLHFGLWPVVSVHVGILGHIGEAPPRGDTFYPECSGPIKEDLRFKGGLCSAIGFTRETYSPYSVH